MVGHDERVVKLRSADGVTHQADGRSDSVVPETIESAHVY